MRYLNLLSVVIIVARAILMPSAALAEPAAYYMADMTFASASVDSTAQATLKLMNTGPAIAEVELLIDIPSGFIAKDLRPNCGGTLAHVSRTNQLKLSGVSIPDLSPCIIKFGVQIPPVAWMPPEEKRVFSIHAVEKAGLAELISIKIEKLRILGATPSLISHTDLTTKDNIARLDFFITPENDPGPNSHVFWSNQIDSLAGYTGMQSTALTSAAEGTGKQFLFSLWGATDAQTGTPPRAGIGGGSYCTVSATATDDHPGVQCRYRYEWQPGHTYRFRVTPNSTLGAGWYISNVTDVTPSEKRDSFDIGSIYVGNNKTLIPGPKLQQWVEYADWNWSRTSCASVAYTKARFSIQAFDKDGTSISVPQPSVSTSTACSPEYAQASNDHGETTLIGGPRQSAETLLRVNEKCLTVQNESTENAPVMLGPCPTLNTVRERGGAAFSNALWVKSGDLTIQTKGTYCLTPQSVSAGSDVVLKTCQPDGFKQRWKTEQMASAAQRIVFQEKGDLCLTPSNNGSVTLQDCATTSAVWTTSDQSFSY
jgi:hypothetical protein